LAANTAARQAFRSASTNRTTFRGRLRCWLRCGARPRRQQLQPPPDWPRALCLTDGPPQEAVLFGAPAARSGLAPRANRASTLDDRSGRQRSLAERLGLRAWPNLDAPVTGGTEGQSRSLSVLWAERCRFWSGPAPAWKVVGSRITTSARWAAGTGQGRSTRLLVAGSYAAVAGGDGPGPAGWGCRLGRRSVRPRQRAAGSWALETAAACWRGSFPRGSRLALHRKGPGHRLWPRQPPPGWSCRSAKTGGGDRDALIEPGHGDEDVSALDPLRSRVSAPCSATTATRLVVTDGCRRDDQKHVPGLGCLSRARLPRS